MRCCRRPIASLTCALGVVVAIGAPAAGASFPGSDGLLAFERGGDIWTVRPDGGGERRIVVEAEHPAWSPDGRRLTFTKQGEALARPLQGVYVADADGGHQRQVASFLDAPSWSPDGRHLAAISRRSMLALVADDGSDLHDVIDPAIDEDYRHPEGDEQRLFDEVAADGPAWSPDGTTIAVPANPYSLRPGRDIWGVSPDGTGFRVLLPVDQQAIASEPDWAPDGSGLAATAYLFARRITRVLGAETGQPDSAQTTSPAHAPDGDGLAYVAGAVDATDLWLHDSTGTRRVVADAARPDWQPLVAPDCASVAPDPWIIRPVDHRLHRVEVTTSQAGIALRVTRVRVSEPSRGNRGPDVVREKAKDVVDLRADRNVAGRGRTYLLDARATGSGGSCTTQVKVVVPGGADWRHPVLPQPADHWYPAVGD